MTHRVNISILFCTISVLTAQAQWSKQDSIRLQQFLKGEEDLKINTEAVKSIHFDFNPEKKPQGKPMMSHDKPWMKFREDLPKNYGDTTQWIKPKYVRASPYTPYTKWNEDPVNDPIVKGEKEWKMNIPFRFGGSSEYDVREERAMPPSKNNNALQVGVGVSYGFDADKLLYENLTKRGRAIKRNRRLAKAWKTYKDYLPTRMDSIKLNLIKNDTLSSSQRDSLLLEDKINSQNKAKESRKVVPSKFHFKRPD